MMHDTTTVNAFSTTAMLRNVSICSAAVDLAVKREIHLPGIVVFHGNSGYGKSTAAAFVANRTKAYYVEVGQNWTRRKFVLAILRQMGMGEERGTVGDLIDKVAEQLALSGRPLIIDEMDSVVARKMVDVVEDIYRASQAPMLLIGEERLPAKLSKWEKFHSRVLEWVGAQPAQIEDGKALRRLYAKRVEIADDLLAHVVKLAEGSVRRIVTNLDRIEKEAIAEGAETMDLAGWNGRALHTGRAPAPRV